MKERHRALPARLPQDANHFIPPAVFARAAQLTFRMPAARRAAEPEPRDLERAGPAVPALLRRRAARGPPPGVGHHRRHGPQHHGDEPLRHLDFGIVADREQMPDLWSTIGWLEESLDELKAAAPQ